MTSKIPTSMEFLDLARKAAGQRRGLPVPISYNALAEELGVSRQAISEIRHGNTTLGQPLAVKIAMLLGREPTWVMACVQAERAQNEGLRELWTGAAKKLAMLLICFAIVAGNWPISAKAAGVDRDIHYALLAFLGLAAAWAMVRCTFTTSRGSACAVELRASQAI